ncbi:beta-ketoacyl synthase N-terminal-like domain-containing protein [Streptomyces sp. WAC06614]|uniref:beta-ketoacyl synthase N-terminal-like domain-containing protein n=1 Tax=Streptomyces sp. WAC06614 TaxID=2487416 RepID=UPI000F7B1559|nr:beta-ketoacyl synthase N-terminal-like domain-containing protein [Streptomyces sp. WAC06614]RSS80814.1 3-oxoacyl-ACP synthase [Streptomyces sp. WAC06614]
MTTLTTGTPRPVITAWSAVSPYGIGRAAFADGLRERRTTVTELGPEHGTLPGGAGHVVPGFSVREVLGKKGTRSMDRVTGLAVAAAGALLDDSPRNRAVGTGEGAAFALGTTTGSAQSMMDFTRDSFTGEQPFFVDPARFPNTVMNCAAGQSAIWFRLKGPNATIAGGRTAGLHALNYSRRLLGAGRARTVLCGAAEEFSQARAWLEHHSGDQPADGTPAAPALGEGCAMLLVEPHTPEDADQPVLAEVLAVELGVVLDGDPGPALVACLRAALRRAGVAPSEVAAVARSGAPGREGLREADAVHEVFGAVGPADLTPTGLIGDTGAAAAAFQAAALLSYAEDRPAEAAGRIGVITSVDRTGTVGCALLGLR